MFTFHMCMFITCYIVIIVFCILFIKDGNYHDDIIIGTTIAPHAHNNEHIQDICHRFKRAMIIESLVMCIVPFPILLVNDFSIVYILEMNWLLVVMIVPYLVYYKYFKEIRAYKKEYNLSPDDGSDEDDAYWFREDFYYNKKNSDFMVQNRYKIGATINFARPFGKISAIVLALILLSCPLPGIFIYKEDHTALSISLDDTSLSVEHIKHECTIDYSNITHIELMYTLQDAHKITGYNSDNLLKGYFNIKGKGRYNIYVDPKAHLFLRIETNKDGYIINIPNNEELNSIYTKLLTKVKTK